MPSIVIKRRGGWTDRFRAYAVTIDGVKRGLVRANQTTAFEVEAGSHQIRLWIGATYSSPVVTVEVQDRDVTMACGPNAIPGLAVLSLAQPEQWIALAPVDQP